MPPMAQEGSISSRSRGERRSSPPKVGVCKRTMSPCLFACLCKGVV